LQSDGMSDLAFLFFFFFQAFIGCGFGTGLAVVALTPKHYSWGIYVTALSFFHFSEYIMTSLYNADTVSFDCELL